MPASPWRTFGSPDSNGDFAALLSYLPLRSYWRVPPFFLYTAQVVKQLASAQGLLGYSVLARPFSKRFWTLSAWENEEALRAFVQYPPHVRIMAALTPHMNETKFVHWTVKGSQLPLQWDDALRRFATVQYLPLSGAKAAACRELFEYAGRICVLLKSPKVQTSASMQASLDDLLGAVYSLIYARSRDYDDRQQTLGPQDIQAVRVRASDMSIRRVRTEGKWTAGFYFNNSLFRVSAIYHRALKIVTGKEKETYADTLRPIAESLFQNWENRGWTSTNLAKLHREVNELKHTPDGIYQGRDIQFSEATSAVDELLTLIEAWAK
jgi:hypothetical protein